MAQKYKVFTENGWLIFQKPAKRISKSSGALVFQVNELNDKQREKIANELKTNNSKSDVYFVHADPEKTMLTFFNDHQLILASGGLVQKNDEFLFIKRHGKWDIPKGKQEGNERTEQTAIREVEEECGITDLKLGPKITKTYHTYEVEGKKVLKQTDWFCMKYKGNENLSPQTEEGITEVKWIKESNFQEVRSNTFETIHIVLEKFEELLIKFG